MMTEILQHLDALHVELSAIDPDRDCNAAQAVADMARALQRVVAAAQEQYSNGSASTSSTRNAA